MYKYVLVLPVAIVEGPALSMLCGFLLRLNYFTIVPLYLVLMVGDLIGDVVWYQVGFRWGKPFIKRFGKYFHINEEKILKVEDIFHRHQSWILLVSKLTTGFGFAVVTLFTAGMVKIPFKKYMLFNIGGQVVWTGLLLSIGYFFGELYTRFNKGIEFFGFIAAIIMFLLILYGLSNYIREKVARI